MQRKLQSNKKQRKSAASWQKQGASERSARPSLSCHRPLHCLGSPRRGSWRGDDPLPARLLSRSVVYISLSRLDGSNPGSPAVISGRLDNVMLFLLVAMLAGFAVQHDSGTATRPLCINGHPALRQSGVTYGGCGRNTVFSGIIAFRSAWAVRMSPAMSGFSLKAKRGARTLPSGRRSRLTAAGR